MNDLDPFRKRAKQLVRQHRAGTYVVAERLRRSLPRFAGLSDREVLAADFALHDAQQVIAAELGFAGPHLRAHLGLRGRDGGPQEGTGARGPERGPRAPMVVRGRPAARVGGFLTAGSARRGMR